MAEGNVSNGKVMMGSGEGFEPFLPSHMLNEATIPTVVSPFFDLCYALVFGLRSPEEFLFQERRSNSNYRWHGSSHPPRSQHRQKNEKLNESFAWGHGHGMRASFMDSCGSRRSCAGTGVFLPKIVTTNVQPVNINPGVNWEWKNNDGGSKSGKSKSHHDGGKETTDQGWDLRASSSAPDTFLPKEWTY